MNSSDFIKRQIKYSHLTPMHLRLENEQLKNKQLEMADVNKWSAFLNLFTKGYSIIEKTIIESFPSLIATIEKEPDKDDVKVKDCFVGEEAIQFLKESSNLEKFIDGNLILQHALQIDNRVMMLFYDIGLNLKDEKQFDDSEAVFFFLTMINPYVSGFWLVKGSINENQQKWNDAIQSYQSAQKLEPASELPYLGLLRSYEAIKDKDGYHATLELIKSNPTVNKLLLE